MTADVEDPYIVAQANEPLNEDGSFVNRRITCRERDQFVEVAPEEVDLMDVSPKQLVSVATAMIPFLENDDANRALMGSNMQRQAVPLLVTEAPYVGTGMEYKAARDSGVVVLAREAGVVEFVDGQFHHHQAGRRPAQVLQTHQVPALQPVHLHQPAPHRLCGRAGGEGAGDRRRRGHRPGRDCSGSAICSSAS